MKVEDWERHIEFFPESMEELEVAKRVFGIKGNCRSICVAVLNNDDRYAAVTKFHNEMRAERTRSARI